MPPILPLAGWRYDPAKVEYSNVTMPPYDIVSSALQNELYKKNDRNSVRIIYGHEFPDDTPANNRYTRAIGHLDAWRSENLFIQDQPSVYIYQQEFSLAGKNYTRRGFLARVLLSDWRADGIYPHEKTLSGPKVDRLQLMRTTRANTEPIFGLLTDAEHEITPAIYGLANYQPAADFLDNDNTRNLLWVVDDAEVIAAFCQRCSQEQIFIADGHHRYETALNYRNEIREAMSKAGQTPPPIGELPQDYILMYLVPDSDAGLVIFPTHRLLYGLPELANLPQRLTTNFNVEKIGDVAALSAKMADYPAPAFGWVFANDLYFVGLKKREIMDAPAKSAVAEWRELDVAVLHTLILDELLGINEEKLLRKENLLYTHSLSEALSAVKNHTDNVQGSFLLRATTMPQVRAISRAGAVMPQKSTYFFPKVVSGMVFNFFW